jgi:hypothetical protein
MLAAPYPKGAQPPVTGITNYAERSMINRESRHNFCVCHVHRGDFNPHSDLAGRVSAPGDGITDLRLWAIRKILVVSSRYWRYFDHRVKLARGRSGRLRGCRSQGFGAQ